MLRARYRRILFFFARILLGLAVWELVLPRLGLGRIVLRTRSRRLRQAASQFRMLAVQLGGVMIKVGQFFSARVDVLPGEITEELAGLQDEVPPEKYTDIRRVVEAEFESRLEEKFQSFEEIPMAAASLGQVHRAWIRAGDAGIDNQAGQAGEQASDVSPLISTAQGDFLQVVVKILRPGIETLINTDLAALRTIGGWINHYGPVRRRANVPALLEEFNRILREETDYLSEGRNAETFAEHFAGDPEVRVPRVIWTHTRQRVLTLEDVQSIKITDFAAIEDAGVDRGEVARRLLNTYLKQIFEDGFFHADPHPGNLFICPLDAPDDSVDSSTAESPSPRSWQLTFVDFGMVGRIPPHLRSGMRELVIAFGTRDAARSIKAYQMLGVLLPNADLALLEQAETEAFNRFWGQSMSELQQISLKEMYEFANQFRHLIYTLPFQIPEDLILLGRTVGILSGMCTALDPNFNVWEAVMPFARKLIAEDILSGRENWLENLRAMALRLVSLPGRSEALLARIERGELKVHDPELTRSIMQLERAVRQVAWALVFSGLLAGGIVLNLSGSILWGDILLAASGLTLAGMLFRSWRGRVE